jgi:hypothetical protein
MDRERVVDEPLEKADPLLVAIVVRGALVDASKASFVIASSK